MDHLTYFALFREVNFNDLNDDCILEIFSNVPLGDLLRLEIVCRRWQYMQELIFRRRKTKLMLMDANTLGIKTPILEIKNCYTQSGIVILPSFHHLRVNLTAEKNAKLLLNKFPKITQLEVVYDRLGDIVPQLLMLLEAWKENLDNLKIIIYNSASTREHWRRLFDEQINHLPALKYLTVKDEIANFGGHRHHMGQDQAPPIPPIDYLAPAMLARLQKFYFGVGESVNHSFGIFNKFTEDAQMERFALANNAHVDIFTPTFDEVNEDWAKKITHLTVACDMARNGHNNGADLMVIPRREHYLAVLCRKFCSVTTLHLTVQLPFTEMTPHLAKLKQLTDLRLTFTNRVFPQEPAIPVEGQQPPPPLKQLQQLHLDCTSNYYYDRTGNRHHVPHQELAHVEHLLPALNVIRVNVAYHMGDFNCPTCKDKNKDTCRQVFVQSMLLNFARQLRRIELLDSNGFSNSWEDMYDEKLLARYNVQYLCAGKVMVSVVKSLPI